MVKYAPYRTEARLLRRNIALAALKVYLERGVLHGHGACVPCVVRRKGRHTRARPQPAWDAVALGQQHAIRLPEPLHEMREVLGCGVLHTR